MGHHRAQSARRTSSVLLCSLALAVFFALPHVVRAQSAGAPPAVKIDADGSVHVPAYVVPMSDMLSPERKAYVTEHLLNMQRPEMLTQKDGVPVLLAGPESSKLSPPPPPNALPEIWTKAPGIDLWPGSRREPAASCRSLCQPTHRPSSCATSRNQIFTCSVRRIRTDTRCW